MVFRFLLATALWFNVSCGTSTQNKEKSINVFPVVESRPVLGNQIHATIEDTLILQGIMTYAQENNLSSLSFPEIMTKVARYFTGTPYEASTLEVEGPEELVVNLREFDCTTFAENVLAISQCIQQNQTGFDDFTRSLIQIRYRDGVIDQYPSRLHYFTDWLVNNNEKGLIRIVSNQIGDAPFKSEVSFMSKHPDKYRQLAENPQFVEDMANIEKRISGYDLKFISGNHIETVAKQIEDGDIIGFCNTLEGLDVSHVAFAVHLPGGLHFIHASLSGKQVELSKVPLSEFVTNSKSIYGILVGRGTGVESSGL